MHSLVHPVVSSFAIKDLIPWVAMGMAAVLLVFLLVAIVKRIGPAPQARSSSTRAASDRMPSDEVQAVPRTESPAEPSQGTSEASSEPPALPNTVRVSEDLEALDPIIQRLDRVLRAQRPDYHRSLLPGLSEDALMAIEETAGSILPPLLRDLYTWRNGQSDDASVPFYFGSLWTSAGEAARARALRNEDLESGESETVWRQSWFPFLVDGDGAYFCVELSVSAEGLSGPVWQIASDDSKRTVVAPSFQAWLVMVLNDWEQREWHLHDGCWLWRGNTRCGL